MLGKCQLTLDLHGKQMQHSFIINNNKEDDILGFDFLQEHQVRLKLNKEDITCQKRTFSMQDGRMTTKVHRIITQQQSIIPPNSEMIVSGTVIDKKGTGTIGIIEGQRFLQDYPIAVAAVE